MTEPTRACIVCGSADLQPFFHLEGVPVEANLLWDDPQSAQNVPRGDILLAFCPNCGHIFNTLFDPQQIVYSAQYENSLFFSPRFQQYAKMLAAGLVERHRLKNKHLVEIGAGKGDFLAALCRLGGNHASAFDPSYDGGENTDPHIRFYRDYYTGQNTAEPADFICARHTLEHIARPVEFVRVLRNAALQRMERQPADTSGQSGAPVYIEVPNARHTLAALAIWDLIYEHVSYFTRPSLEYLFTQNGFQACRVDESYEGQFLALEGQPDPDHSTPLPNAANQELLAGLSDLAAGFATRSLEKIQHWRVQIDHFKKRGQRVAVWGAGSKGISFLNMLQLRDEIEVVVDLNPRKHGKYITGTGQRILAPHDLSGQPPDAVIIMNPIYTGEILQTLANSGLQPEILVA